VSSELLSCCRWHPSCRDASLWLSQSTVLDHGSRVYTGHGLQLEYTAQCITYVYPRPWTTISHHLFNCGLQSQIKEDIGEPSVPAYEINPTAYAKSRQITQLAHPVWELIGGACHMVLVCQDKTKCPCEIEGLDLMLILQLGYI